jgi:hypothetical protein
LGDRYSLSGVGGSRAPGALLWLLPQTAFLFSRSAKSAKFPKRIKHDSDGYRTILTQDGTKRSSDVDGHLDLEECDASFSSHLRLALWHTKHNSTNPPLLAENITHNTPR